MFGSSQVTFSGAMWFCICLTTVSLLTGMLIGDRYQPFGMSAYEKTVEKLENRLDNQGRDIAGLKETILQMTQTATP